MWFGNVSAIAYLPLTDVYQPKSATEAAKEIARLKAWNCSLQVKYACCAQNFALFCHF